MTIKLTEKQIQDGWQVVKFGEIAKNISERVEPAKTDLKIYVGLEHLDSQSLRITRRGVPSDVKGQKLRVRPGQIIFGKRRAYQKKVAVADFDGICSAHAMVLEAIPGKIIPELLPFFMQSDMFMDRAVAISEGSLSPTIKWKTLAIQEFPLPPLERQKEILEVLEKLEEVDLRLSDSVESCLVSLRRLVDYACNSDRNKEPFSNFRRFRLKDICKSNLRSLDTKTDNNYEFEYVDISSCSFPGLLEKPERMTFNDAPSRARRIVSDGDILVSTVRPNHQATYMFPVAKDIIASTGFTVISPKDTKYSKWVFYSTLTKQFVYNLSNLMVGTSFPAVNDDDIKIQHIDIPEGKYFDSWLTALGGTYKLYNIILSKRKLYLGIRTNVLKVFFELEGANE